MSILGSMAARVSARASTKLSTKYSLRSHNHTLYQVDDGDHGEEGEDEDQLGVPPPAVVPEGWMGHQF